MKCKFCKKEAVIKLKEYNLNLCKDDFIIWLERKVWKFVKKKKLIKDGDKVCIALSGGKDSSALLFILAKMRNLINFELKGIHLNLGIENYSNKVENAVKKLCEKAKIPLFVYNLKEEKGYTLEEVAKKKRRSPCSVCGVVKRYLFNKMSKELGCNILVTGHNLDDFLNYFFKNLENQQFEWLTKIKPSLTQYEGFVKKVRPLFEIPEYLLKIYCEFSNIKYVKEKCPYTQEEFWKKVLDYASTIKANVKLNLIKAIEKLNLSNYEIERRERLKKCKICNEPSSKEICSFCSLFI